MQCSSYLCCLTWHLHRCPTRQGRGGGNTLPTMRCDPPEGAPPRGRSGHSVRNRTPVRGRRWLHHKPVPVSCRAGRTAAERGSLRVVAPAARAGRAPRRPPAGKQPAHARAWWGGGNRGRIAGRAKSSQAPRASVAPNYRLPGSSQLVAQIPGSQELPAGNQNHCPSPTRAPTPP